MSGANPTREFGVRLAVGSTPRELWTGVLWDGVRIAAFGIAVGGRRLRARARGGEGVGDGATARRGIRHRRSNRAHRRGGRRVTHAGHARVPCRCPTGASIRIGTRFGSVSKACRCCMSSDESGVVVRVVRDAQRRSHRRACAGPLHDRRRASRMAGDKRTWTRARTRLRDG